MKLLKNKAPDCDIAIKGETKEVATVGITHNGKLLMGKRNDNGKWTNPGGHLDPGEKPVDGAKRELYEEAGIKVDKLKKLASKMVTTPKGKKMKIHAFTVDMDKKPKTTSKHDPDEEVDKWEWIDTDPKLPKKVSENLHSPKNVLLDGLKIEKSHKYIRRWKKNGKWVYEYAEPGQRKRKIPQEAFDKIKQLADAGNEKAKKIIESMEDVEAPAPRERESATVQGLKIQKKTWQHSGGRTEIRFHIMTKNEHGYMEDLDTSATTMADAKKKAKQIAKKLKMIKEFKRTFRSPVSGDSFFVQDSGWGQLEVDRYRRHDHGGGEFGDDWLPSEEIEKDYQQGLREHGHKLKIFNEALKQAGFEPNGKWDLGEKGHFSINFTLQPKMSDAELKRYQKQKVEQWKENGYKVSRLRSGEGTFKLTKERVVGQKIDGGKRWDNVQTTVHILDDRGNTLSTDRKQKFVKKSEQFVIDLVKGDNVTIGGFFIPDLIKARPHKYLRKYKGRDGKWVYIYHEGDNKGRRIPEEAYNAIHSAAEQGHEGAKSLRDSMEEHHPEKLDLLRRLADKDAGRSSEMAKKQLLKLGINREEERLKEAVTPETGPMQEDLGDRAKDAHSAIKKAIKDKVFGYLAGHRGTPFYKRLEENGVTLDSVMSEVEKHNNVHDMLEELHKQMEKVDEAHSGLPRSANQAAVRAGGYGNLGYKAAMDALRNTRDVKNQRPALMPANYQHERGQEHDQEAYAQQMESETEATNREFEAKRAEIERERREMAELEGSMAHHMASLIEGRPRNRVETARKLDQAIRRMFGKSLRKEDFPYDFSSNNIDVKITSVSVGRDSFSMSLAAYDKDGNRINESWNRVWSMKNGGPHIYNDYLVVKSQHRQHNLGSLINQSQQKLMIDHAPNTGSVGVTAALSVGGYNWANQGFSFASPATLSDYRRSFKSYARSKGVNLTDADMQKFTKPYHFAAFDDGKRYPINTSKSMELTPEQIESRSLDGSGKHPLTAAEIREGKTGRMMAHLGKTFMLGKSWRGIWKAKGHENDSAYKFSQKYAQMKTRAASDVDTGYASVISAVGAGERRAPVREPARSSAPTRGSPDVSPQVSRVLRRWAPTGRNRSYTINDSRIRTMNRWTSDQIREFMRLAPMSRTGRARVRRILLERERGS